MQNRLPENYEYYTKCTQIAEERYNMEHTRVGQRGWSGGGVLLLGVFARIVGISHKVA